ncbi:tudor domain-containing protein 10 isoform X1 [Pseudophryne corroboree]|uniref:tudor domain-containing protein 10 isoform X1 n=1 Tax=Pseudophryne corroboree TaxID=495146 RepID=UPI003081AF1C
MVRFQVEIETKREMAFSSDLDDCKQVYVGNVAYDVRENDILTVFKDYEPVHVRMMHRDQRCYAFVQLTSEENASQAITKLNGTSLYGRNLIVKPSSRDYKRKPGALQLQVKAPVPASDSTMRLPAKDVKAEDGTFNENFPFYVTDDLKTVLQSESNDQEIPSSSCGHYFAGKLEHKLYVDNLSRDVTKKDLLLLFDSYNPLSVWRPQNSEKCIAVVDVTSDEDVIQALTHLNGTMFKGSCLTVVSMFNELDGVTQSKTEPELPPMPALELVPQPDHGDCGDGPADGRAHRNSSMIPAEMSGAFLVSMLKDCYSDLSWLEELVNLSGELALLVTHVYPGIAYFWGVIMNKETCVTLIDLCNSLVQVETQLPYLNKGDVQRGMRCLARVTFAGEERTLCRCWVNDVVSDNAVVFFVDYGLTEVLPVETLKPLNDAQYWHTPPMARPFLLLQGLATSDLSGNIVKGRICSRCSRQWHIRPFRAFTQED